MESIEDIIAQLSDMKITKFNLGKHLFTKVYKKFIQEHKGNKYLIDNFECTNYNIYYDNNKSYHTKQTYIFGNEHNTLTLKHIPIEFVGDTDDSSPFPRGGDFYQFNGKQIKENDNLSSLLDTLVELTEHFNDAM